MATVNVHEARTRLSRRLAQVGVGEEVTIARNGKPVARLVACKPHRASISPPRNAQDAPKTLYSAPIAPPAAYPPRQRPAIR